MRSCCVRVMSCAVTRGCWAAGLCPTTVLALRFSCLACPECQSRMRGCARLLTAILAGQVRKGSRTSQAGANISAVIQMVPAMQEKNCLLGLLAIYNPSFGCLAGNAVASSFPQIASAQKLPALGVRTRTSGPNVSNHSRMFVFKRAIGSLGMSTKVHEGSSVLCFTPPSYRFWMVLNVCPALGSARPLTHLSSWNGSFPTGRQACIAITSLLSHSLL